MNDFSERVLQVVREIPRGKVTNYGFVAFAAGKPRASRGVGFVLHRNTDPVNTPCHRVVFKDAPWNMVLWPCMKSTALSSKPRACGSCPTAA